MWYKEILKFIGIVGLVLLVFFIFNISPNSNFNKQNELLKFKIDSLQSTIDSSKVKIDRLDSINKVYQLEIKNTKQKLSDLKIKSDLYKKKYNEEHNRINNLSNDAIVSEFTNAFQ
jgi:hypothetical protein